MADAYCIRSNALSDLQRFDEATQDANEAIRLAPNAASTLGCRAINYFNAGQLEKSIADIRRPCRSVRRRARSFACGV